jgi:hypothetical protein
MEDGVETRSQNTNTAASLSASAEELPELGHPPTPMWAVWGTLIVLVAAGVVGLADGLRGPRTSETLSIAPVATAASSALPPPPTVLRTIQARHLVVKYAGAEGAGDKITRSREEARQLANQYLARVKKGEDLGALAAQFSDDAPTAQNRGDLGWIHERKVSSEFWKAVDPLEDGAISGVVETPMGFHIIQRTK